MVTADKRLKLYCTVWYNLKECEPGASNFLMKSYSYWQPFYSYVQSESS